MATPLVCMRRLILCSPCLASVLSLSCDLRQIGCDNEDCEHGEWFHYKCVGLEQVVSFPPTAEQKRLQYSKQADYRRTVGLFWHIHVCFWSESCRPPDADKMTLHPRVDCIAFPTQQDEEQQQFWLCPGCSADKRERKEGAVGDEGRAQDHPREAGC